jgi:RHH-type proline utilization regulon transcriptional repressor/proline dehydrogenase/delta 1-pyrroline-5-carboxylate dehydrogenase
MHTSTYQESEPTSEMLPFAAFHAEISQHASPLRHAISQAYRRDESEAVQWLLSQANAFPSTQSATATLARQLVLAVREKRTTSYGVDALMHEFSLSSEEGVALMCLAEALLRIPDRHTADQLIADKIGKGNWHQHLGESPSLFVNAATWGLLVTGKLTGTASQQGLTAAITRLIAKGGEPLIRKGFDLAMRLLGNQFVTGQTIAEALANSRDNEKRGYRYSYDMLGEAALTAVDAARYYAAYENAIHAIGQAANGRGIKDGPGISVKLSALHPRYARTQRDKVMQELLPRLKVLFLLAKRYDIGLNIDAEEADRLELSLDLLEALAFDPELAGFNGIGFVVQAYQKRCPFVIDYLIDLAQRSQHKFMVRLVKGAYWDSEIKRAQVDGMPGYPVYTRKVYTDVSYLVCAFKLLNATQVIYPQFATHNAHTLASIYTWAQRQNITDYEFQCLYGMGEALYDEIVGAHQLNQPCRIYAPVGSHETLLAYLVRRLLENGANSSFVNQILGDRVSIDSLLNDPALIAQQLDSKPHPQIPLPVNLYGKQRKNSVGIDLNDDSILHAIDIALSKFSSSKWYACPLLNGHMHYSDSSAHPIINPADHRDIVGDVVDASKQDIEIALANAEAHAMDWQTVAPDERAARLNYAADLFELHRDEFIALAIREAGKSLPNAVGEVREAIDFLRYYAMQIRETVPTLALGPVVCISPWNFPLAIFTGQVSASLAAGNVVVAKPAEQTPLIAYRAVELLHTAGIPANALQILPGRGEIVGAKLVADARVRGVLFTGSTEVAQMINRTLARRAVNENTDIPLIAETGGQNAMIVDSSALPEQVVHDAIQSAFDSAGQRCSALRVLCVQEDIAEKILSMLQGAMQELCVGNPDRLSTDIGPVIDADAQQHLHTHIENIGARANHCFQMPLLPDTQHGTFIAPAVVEINSFKELQREVFGPVLHVIRFAHHQLPQLIDDINATGYGLTLGVHSRIDETIRYIETHAHVGNIYVNRNMIGAVVGVQPFGGEGKSGTGPKAGGPLYLARLQRDQRDAMLHLHGVVKIDTPPSTSNMLLLNLSDWCTNHVYPRITAFSQHYAAESLIHKTLTLPGPTGEQNRLRFAPRGNVLCIFHTVEALFNQLAAVFATGNTPYLLRSAMHLLPSDFPPQLRNALQWLESKDIAHAEFHIALIEASQLPARRIPIAAREGALIPVIETSADTPIPLWRLVAERAICINTTAAGGNTSLMTLQE